MNGYWNKSIAVGAAAFLLGFCLAHAEVYPASGAVMIVLGIWIAVQNLKASSLGLSPAAYFSASWIGGAGVSSLKLSFLQEKWVAGTWLCLAGTYVFFMLAYMIAGTLLRERLSGTGSAGTDPVTGLSSAPAVRLQTAWMSGSAGAYMGRGGGGRKAYGSGADPSDRRNRIRRSLRLLQVMNVMIFLSLAALLIEIYILGYLPLFTRDTPHAYSYFHVTGLHYFTVLCSLLPALGILYFGGESRVSRGRFLHVGLMSALGFVIPILLVSRFQLILSLALAVLAGASQSGIRPGRLFNARLMVLGGSAFLMFLALYVFITVERAHSVEYLNGIFEMRNPETPIWITQPYIYIANNFDNLNCLVRDLGQHSHGLRMLFPLFALTGMKFLFPNLVSFPLYITKEELTTVTLVYDAYYDFGIPGVLLFAALLGLAAALLEAAVVRFGESRPLVHLIFAEFCFYLLFAFFTTWFSNPATWFYLAASLLGLWWMRPRRGRR